MIGKKEKNIISIKNESSLLSRKYNMVFTCNLCGKIFFSEDSFTEEEIDNGHADYGYLSKEKHHCDDGNIGTLKFMGFWQSESSTKKDKQI